MNAQSGSIGKEILQVGILVTDVEDAARKLERLIGIGPFEVMESDYRDILPGKAFLNSYK